MGPTFQGLMFWNYKKSKGHQYPPESYTRNLTGHNQTTWTPGAINRTNNTITLDQPYAGPEASAGTSISQKRSGGYNNSTITLVSYSSTPVKTTRSFTGFDRKIGTVTAAYYGAEYIQPFIQFSSLNTIDYFTGFTVTQKQGYFKLFCLVIMSDEIRIKSCCIHEKQRWVLTFC